MRLITFAPLAMAYGALGAENGATDDPKAPAGQAVSDPTIMPGTISTCNSYHLVTSDEVCNTIVNKYHTFTLADFYSWNPGVGDACQTLMAGYKVCVGVSPDPATPDPAAQKVPLGQAPPAPSPKPAASPNIDITTGTSPTPTGPTKPGIIPSCNKYYPVVTGDTCGLIAARYNIKVSDIEAWNTGVGPNCFIETKYSYCVGVTAPVLHSLTSYSPSFMTQTKRDAGPTSFPN